MAIEKVAASQFKVDFENKVKNDTKSKDNVAGAASAPRPTEAPKESKEAGSKAEAKSSFAAGASAQSLKSSEAGTALKEGLSDIAKNFKEKLSQAFAAPPPAPPVVQAQQNTAKNDVVGQEQAKSNTSAVSANIDVTKNAAKNNENKSVTTDAKVATQDTDTRLKQASPASGAPTSVEAPTLPNAGEKESLTFKPAAEKAGSVEAESAAQERRKFDPDKLKNNLAALEQAKATAPDSASAPGIA